MDEADKDRWVLLCNSGIVLTARISDPSAGEDRAEDDALGTDKVLLLVVVAVISTSGLEMVVDGVDDDVGRTKDLSFS